MSERGELEVHIQQHIKLNAVDPVQSYSADTARVVMEALDSWIEEQQQPEREPMLGDTVKLRHNLKQGDGSKTDTVSHITPPMEAIDPCQPCGKVIDVVGARKGEGKEVLVCLFESHYGGPEEWYFHIDDLEVTH